MKRLISLAAVFAVAATTVFAVVAYASAQSALKTTVKVTAKDNFRITLSRTSAPHGKVSFKVAGDLDPVIKAIARRHVLDMELTHPTLEEIFLSYYREGEG